VFPGFESRDESVVVRSSLSALTLLKPQWHAARHARRVAVDGPFTTADARVIA
jgi:hypothetical protein